MPATMTPKSPRKFVPPMARRNFAPPPNTGGLNLHTPAPQNLPKSLDATRFVNIKGFIIDVTNASSSDATADVDGYITKEMSGDVLWCSDTGNIAGATVRIKVQFDGNENFPITFRRDTEVANRRFTKIRLKWDAQTAADYAEFVVFTNSSK